MNDSHLFFIQTPPGLEELAKKELFLKFPHVKLMDVVEGGLLIGCLLEEGFSFNFSLKIPNRILLRIASFKCRDLPKLYNKIRKIDWSSYLSFQDLAIQASAAQSRLFHTQRIIETTQKGIQAYLKGQPPKEKFKSLCQENQLKQRIYIRLFKDQCEVSIDTSGERLGYRGYRPFIGKAPLRENLAAALYFQAFLDSPELQTIIDPFCGSGTLLFESYFFWINNLKRNYSFQYFPIVLNSSIHVSPKESSKEQNLKLYGQDFSSEQIKQCQRNLAEVSKEIETIPLELKKENSLLSPFPKEVDILITNPPYNKRVSLDQSHFELLQSLEKNFRAKTYYVLLPQLHQKKTFTPKGLTNSWKSCLRFKNGGLPVELFKSEKQ